MKYTCPCCGYRTLDEQSPGKFDICEICFWEDDYVQFIDPDFKGGANGISLRQAQKNFLAIGAYEECFIESVRNPNEKDERDPFWKPVE